MEGNEKNKKRESRKTASNTITQERKVTKSETF